ncbi:hypothetical protein RRF57_012196 [Xylaria bambusicola]|uniref:DUF4185 domain-containing protein n=1 Tax=Xylaria bambusicola TaxID=326684 RepID=A0AAN7V5D6_9PEZI
MIWCVLLGSLLLQGVSSSVISKRAFTPTVKSATVVGNVADPAINRDSCGSSRQPFDSNGVPTLPIWASSASWSNINADGTPDLLQYGGGGSRDPYFFYTDDECNTNSAGSCPDGSRYALWPDSPPLVTSTDNNVVTAYTWIRKSRISQRCGPSAVNSTVTLIDFSFSTPDPDPATSLYKMTYSLDNPDRNALPAVSLVDENFWLYGGIPYGAYGSVIKDGTAYLFGKPSNGIVALAKVPAGSIEDKSQYQYWINGAWTSGLPGLNDTNVNIPNVSAGGQGTYYFSDFWNKWVWIGQAGISVSADYFITTADSITGPWESSVNFYSGETGTYPLGAYTLQAHPGLNPGGSTATNEIYISHTKNDAYANTALYSTPLIHIEWN